MSDALTWTLSGLAGFILGVTFFVGLWWTTKKVLASTRPTAWLMGSLIVRMGIAAGGFYLVSDGQWQRLLFCLAGFLIARTVTTKFILRS